MLGNLIDSKLKKRLLSIFFAFPKRSFSIRELREMAKSTETAVARILRDLIKLDSLRVAVRNRKRYFQINRHFPFFEEVRSLVDEERIPENDPVTRELQKLKGQSDFVLLTGIFVAEPQLSTDLLIVGSRVGRKKLQNVMGQVNRLMGQEVNYTVMDLEEFDYRRQMSDRFTRDIMDHSHKVVINNLKKAKQHVLV